MTLPAINPVALKELRQLVRSRIISLLLVGYPILLFIVFSLAKSLSQEDKSALEIAYGSGAGEIPFAVVGVITGMATCVIIPLVSSIKTAFEYIKGRLGLEFTTTLTPAQIINGKLISAGMISGALVAVSMPFFAVTYLMRGVELYLVFVVPALLFLASIAQTALCLPTATSTNSAPIVRVLKMFVLNIAACIFFFVSSAFSWGFASKMTGSPAPFVYIPVSLVALIAFARSLAAAKISPPFVDGDHSLRRTTAIIFAASLPMPFFWGWETWGVCWGIAVITLFSRSASSPIPMPRAVIGKAPKNIFKRLLAYPFATGPFSGQFFALSIFAVTVVVGCCLTKNLDSWLRHTLSFLETLWVIFFATAIGRRIGSQRALKGMSVLAVVWIVIANFSNLLAAVSSVENSPVSILPCNYFGIAKHPIAHCFVAALMTMPGVAIFSKLLFREFKRYRRP